MANDTQTKMQDTYLDSEALDLVTQHWLPDRTLFEAVVDAWLATASTAILDALIRVALEHPAWAAASVFPAEMVYAARNYGVEL